MDNLYLFLQPRRFFALKVLGFSLLMVLICSQLRAQLSIPTVGVPVTQNFDGMGTSATATLPTGFVLSNATPPDWVGGTTTTGRAAGTTGAGIITSSSAGDSYNFANGVTGSATDRSLGFLNSGSFSSPRSIILKIKNNTGGPIGQLAVTFDYEKYRSGKRQFDWTFFHGNTSTPSIAAAAGIKHIPVILITQLFLTLHSELQNHLTLPGFLYRQILCII